MPLSKEQLAQIEDIINHRVLHFTFNALGKHALTEKEIAFLRRKGLLKRGVKHFTGDAYSLGLIAAIAPKHAKDLTFEQVRQAALKMNVPRTEIEKRAIAYASEHAGEYIKGLKDSMLKTINTTVARSKGAALRSLQEGVSSAIADRETVGELKSDLYHMFEDTYRDWHRVAHTEMQNAF